MKVWTILFCGLVGAAGGLLGAIPSHALTLEWDRNTESDMKEYHLKGCDTGATCTIDPTVTIGVVPQTLPGAIPFVVLPIGKEGRRALTAVDLSGNESGLSVSVPFDAAPPSIPVNPRVR